jgi:hypothetical protein
MEFNGGTWEKNNFFQIEVFVNKLCAILMEKNKKMDIVELYRKAHRHTNAAFEMGSFKTRLIDALRLVLYVKRN